jgi:tripartite ATP-independent transporter DctM subunit
MLLRVPVVIALGSAAIAALIYAGFADALYIVPQQILQGIDSPPLIAVAFFILAGNLMNAFGMTDRIFDFANALVGHFKAGLAQVNVLASLIFAGISGSAVADCAGLGNLVIKAMRTHGYPAPFACAVTVAASIIGPTVPPSIPLVIYAFAASTSVERLFLAGVVPGLLLAATLMLYNRVVSVRADFPRSPRRAPIREVGARAIDGAAALVAPGIILGSIMTGAATATEAGVIACAYTLLLGLCYRTFNVERFTKALTESTLITGLVMIIIGFSTVVAWLLAIEQVPQSLGAMVLGTTGSKYVFLATLLVFLLVLGAFVEPIPAMIILIPMLLPLVDHFGISRVHFGLILVFALMIGLSTPPMGIALYIVSEIAKVPYERVALATIPLHIPLIFVLILITFVPELTLWLPAFLLGPEK